MDRKFISNLVFISVFSFFAFFNLTPLYAAGTPGAGEVNLFGTTVKPNVLIILDNSNSMDEDFLGNAVGSYTTGSKSVEGKRVLNTLVNTYANTMRLGLMTYQLSSDVSPQSLHNELYFAEYDPRSYCPNPPSACVQYCQTGSSMALSTCQNACVAQNPSFQATYIDDSISCFSYSSDPTAPRNRYCSLAYPKTNRLPNPTDNHNYIYYQMALPLYWSSYIQQNYFWYSSSYACQDPTCYYGYCYGSDYYSLYSSKTGTSDGSPGTGYYPPYSNGYSNWAGSESLYPTDSDIALGYQEFGRRMYSFYVGQTWFSNDSPGGGYLQVSIADNNQTNTQLNSLLTELTTYENNQAGYMNCSQGSYYYYFNYNQCPHVINAGLTPTAGTLQTAINYFQGNLSQSGTSFPTPISASCQKNFIVYVTDGAPDTDQNGNSGTTQSLLPTVLQKIQNLTNLAVNGTTYNIQTYVVGVGMTSADQATLNQMAVAGGTAVGGQAYYANNPAQLQAALGNIFSNIYQSAYSFATNSVTSVRITSENYTYQASFTPASNDPFWQGHLEKYNINTDGSIGSMVWDAGAVLQQQVQSSSRNVLTYVGGSMTQFAAPPNGPGWGTWQGYLGTDTNTAKSIIGYIQGSSNPDNWELGDIFHSNPIVIGSPSTYFIDPLSPNAFSTFRTNEQNRQWIVLAGANDGQFHAFDTGTGSELWSFIPPNLLPKLQYLAHSSNSGTLPAHMYFVDGPVAAGDVWLGSGNGTNKSASDWRSLLVFSEGRGVRDSTNTTASYLWSSSQSCDGGFQYQYDSGHPYYCGYWVFDVTNTSATTPTLMTSCPSSKWHIPLINPSSSQAPYLAEPWSKMAIGKVIIGGSEKWVGFIGGGYDNSGDSNRGKGFFVVDLTSGNILWSFTRGGSTTSTTSTSMTYSIPGSAAIVDTDNDGFVDTAYIGDLGGNVWRFTFCTGANGSGCNTSNWSGGLFFSSTGLSPIPLIYTTPSAGRGSSGDIWVFWGTGDKGNPTATGTQDWFFGVKDNDRSSTYTSAQLQNITNSVFSYASPGWYITLGSGEKVLSDSSTFGGMVSWTTYVPYTGTNPCNQVGTSNLYSVAMMPVAIGGVTYQVGAGLFATTTGNVVGTRSMALGSGIAQVPIYSQKPSGTGSGTGATDAYISTSGGGGSNPSITSSAAMGNSPTPFTQRLQATAPSGQLLHWLDQRMH
jgi:type IV pilus assembly protein PilY1